MRLLLCDDLPTTLPCQQFWLKLSERSAAIKSVLPFIFSFPNSNAGTERTFSVLKAVHTPVRNSLAFDTINAILSVKQNKVSAATVIDDKDMLTKACKNATRSYNLQHASTSSRSDN